MTRSQWLWTQASIAVLAAAAATIRYEARVVAAGVPMSPPPPTTLQ